MINIVIFICYNRVHKCDTGDIATVLNVRAVEARRRLDVIFYIDRQLFWFKIAVSKNEVEFATLFKFLGSR